MWVKLKTNQTNTNNDEPYQDLHLDIVRSILFPELINELCLQNIPQPGVDTEKTAFCQPDLNVSIIG